MLDCTPPFPYHSDLCHKITKSYTLVIVCEKYNNYDTISLTATTNIARVLCGLAAVALQHFPCWLLLEHWGLWVPCAALCEPCRSLRGPVGPGGSPAEDPDRSPTEELLRIPVEPHRVPARLCGDPVGPCGALGVGGGRRAGRRGALVKMSKSVGGSVAKCR